MAFHIPVYEDVKNEIDAEVSNQCSTKIYYLY
jgi:hypothetical protein